MVRAHAIYKSNETNKISKRTPRVRARPAPRLILPRYEPRLRLGSPRDHKMSGTTLSPRYRHLRSRCRKVQPGDPEKETYTWRETLPRLMKFVHTSLNVGVLSCTVLHSFRAPVFAHFTVSRSRTRNTNFSLDRNSFLETNEEERKPDSFVGSKRDRDRWMRR